MAKRPDPQRQTELPPPAEGGSYVVKDGVRTRVEEATREVIAGAGSRHTNPTVAGDGVGGAAIGGDGGDVKVSPTPPAATPTLPSPASEKE